MHALVETEGLSAYAGVAIERQSRRKVNAPVPNESHKNTPISIIHNDERHILYDSDADENIFSQNPNARDMSLLRELVYGVTRWKLTLDEIIFHFSTVKKSKVSPRILAILRLGAYQLIYLDKIPASAACNECVKLAKKYGNEGSVRFVNALLRKLSSINKNALFSDLFSHDIDSSSLSIKYSYPLWISDRWLNRYGFDFTTALMDASNQKPNLTIRANALITTVTALSKKLTIFGYTTHPGLYSNNALTISDSTDIFKTLEFINGHFSVQDESSMLAVEALAPQPDDDILDMCAAPGGKCGYIAEMTNDSAKILAADSNPGRLALMEQNLQRLGLKSVRTQIIDALTFNPIFENTFNKVLLDAPCSGLGVIRRKPDIKWSRNEQDIKTLASIQSAMLENASRYVKPGGTLVYSVCTTEPEECEDIINSFLYNTTNYQPENLHPYLPQSIWGPNKNTSDNSGLYIYPHMHGIDGFYIAKLKRT